LDVSTAAATAGVEADIIETPTAPEATIATTAAEANMRRRPAIR
jgi:hypothetical protein